MVAIDKFVERWKVEQVIMREEGITFVIVKVAYLSHLFIGIQQTTLRTVERHTRNTLFENEFELVGQNLFLVLGLPDVAFVCQRRDDSNGQVVARQILGYASVVEIAPAGWLLIVKLVIPAVLEVSRLNLALHQLV